MPTFEINQLVRDKRVKLFEAEGCKVQHTLLSETEMDDALRGKLMEEATEAALADEESELLKEVADVLEAAMALAALNGFSMDDVLAKVAERKQALGGFEGRTYIEQLTAPEGSETAAYHRANKDKYKEVEG